MGLTEKEEEQAREMFMTSGWSAFIEQIRQISATWMRAAHWKTFGLTKAGSLYSGCSLTMSLM
jgi:hypothetical protein